LRGGDKLRVDSVPMPRSGVSDPGVAVIAERGTRITAREAALMDRLATVVGAMEVARRHSSHDQMDVDAALRGRLTMAQLPQDAGDVVMSQAQPPPPPPPPPAAPAITTNNNASNAGSSDSAASIAMAFRAANEEYMRTRGVDEQRQVAAAPPVDDGDGRSRRRRVGDGQAVRVDPGTGLTDARLAEKKQHKDGHVSQKQFLSRDQPALCANNMYDSFIQHQIYSLHIWWCLEIICRAKKTR
jgi:hypothetical protein